MERITIRAFRAPDDKASCSRYIMEFIRVLDGIGVTSAFKPDVAWCTDPDSIVFVAEHQIHGMVGGIRLQRANSRAPLPMQSSLKELAPDLRSSLDPLMARGNAELGALWNSSRFAGRGIPHLLISAAVASANQTGLGSMVCLVAEYIEPYCTLNGFRPITSVGENGRFVFPVPSIHSYAMAIQDTLTMETAHPDLRKRLMSLRIRPRQTRIEQPKSEPLIVEYDTLLDTAIPRYHLIAELRSRFAA